MCEHHQSAHSGTPPPPAHPCIPNSSPGAREEMLRGIGVDSADELHGSVPEQKRLGRRLGLPEPFMGKCELRRHVEGLPGKKRHCGEHLNSRGGGCWYAAAGARGRGRRRVSAAGPPSSPRVASG